MLQAENKEKLQSNASETLLLFFTCIGLFLTAIQIQASFLSGELLEQTVYLTGVLLPALVAYFSEKLEKNSIYTLSLIAIFSAVLSTTMRFKIGIDASQLRVFLNLFLLIGLLTFIFPPIRPNHSNFFIMGIATTSLYAIFYYGTPNHPVFLPFSGFVDRWHISFNILSTTVAI